MDRSVRTDVSSGRPSQEAHLVEPLYRAGGRTISEFEELFSFTRSTIYQLDERVEGGDRRHLCDRAVGRAGVRES